MVENEYKEIKYRIRKGGRVLKFKEEPCSFETYIAREDYHREVLVDMGWTNGTQYQCNGFQYELFIVNKQ